MRNSPMVGTEATDNSCLWPQPLTLQPRVRKGGARLPGEARAIKTPMDSRGGKRHSSFISSDTPRKTQSWVLAVPSPQQSLSVHSLDSNQRLQLPLGAASPQPHVATNMCPWQMKKKKKASTLDNVELFGVCLILQFTIFFGRSFIPKTSRILFMWQYNPIQVYRSHFIIWKILHYAHIYHW